MSSDMMASMALSPLQSALLDLGLEDDIPLAEAFEDHEVCQHLSEGDDPVKQYADALVNLVDRGLIHVFRGHWDDDEPQRLTDPDARQVLYEPRWYRWEDDRLYFVNVENVGP